ncbi:hypothetical protein B0H14DRAFT_3137870 [Mycena olivaceomarginata]|nr:hypothetical protein B0H14DRAFT_3137870 [Mycena olivaceomarginata]
MIRSRVHKLRDQSRVASRPTCSWRIARGASLAERSQEPKSLVVIVIVPGVEATRDAGSRPYSTRDVYVVVVVVWWCATEEEPCKEAQVDVVTDKRKKVSAPAAAEEGREESKSSVDDRGIQIDGPKRKKSTAWRGIGAGGG